MYIQRRPKRLSVHRCISKPDVQPDHTCAFTLPRFKFCFVHQRARCLSSISRVSRGQSDDGPSIPASAARVTRGSLTVVCVTSAALISLTYSIVVHFAM